MRPTDQAPTTEPAGGHHDAGDVTETHPAFGQVVLHRVKSNPAVSLFDSEIQHRTYITLTVKRATRTRSLKTDWIHDTGPAVVSFAMSEAQWASLVSSFGQGGGTPVTLEYTETDGQIPTLPFEPRLALSMDETRQAAAKIKARLDAAVTAVEEKPTKANVRALRNVLNGIEPNIEYAAKSLTEHTENVVQKARADIEAMVVAHADQIGLPAADRPALALGTAEPDAT